MIVEFLTPILEITGLSVGSFLLLILVIHAFIGD